MENDILLEKIEMDCPICGQQHFLEKHSRISRTIIKDEKIEFNEVYFLCSNAIGSEYCEFVPAGILNENLLNARNEYRRKHGLLTSDDIINIRASYGLTQVEFTQILGFGEVTVARFETKLIQSKPFDDIIRSARDDMVGFLAKLETNKLLFSLDRYNQIKHAVLCEMLRIKGISNSQNITITSLSNRMWKTYQNTNSVIGQIVQAASDQILPVLNGSLSGKDECYLSNHGELITALADAA